jgi:hypothetical protein
MVIFEPHLFFSSSSLVEEFWRKQGFWREIVDFHGEPWRNVEEHGEIWRGMEI